MRRLLLVLTVCLAAPIHAYAVFGQVTPSKSSASPKEIEDRVTIGVVERLQCNTTHLSTSRDPIAAERSSSCWAWLSSLAISQLSGLSKSP